MASLLPLPDDPRIALLLESWPDTVLWPNRARWLTSFEGLLFDSYPQSSSRDRKLTARFYFPGYLRDGHNVP